MLKYSSGELLLLKKRQVSLGLTYVFSRISDLQLTRGFQQRQSNQGIKLAISWLILSKKLYGATCRSLARLDGKTVIITGANTGIGKETALDLSIRGARIILACRDTKRGEEAAKDIRFKTGNTDIVFKKLDLASFKSIRAFAQDVLKSESKIHILINNAGLAITPKSKTEDGYEMQFGVNHLGHFLLTLLLLDRIKESTPARIINVSSVLHWMGKIHFDDISLEKNYNPVSAYSQSKLANVLFTQELAKRLKGTGVTTYCLHPGAVHTELSRYSGDALNRLSGVLWYVLGRFFFKTAKQGAQTTIYCAVDEEIANESGCYYNNCHKEKLLPHARDEDAAKKLWEISETFTESKFLYH